MSTPVHTLVYETAGTFGVAATAAFAVAKTATFRRWRERIELRNRVFRELDGTPEVRDASGSIVQPAVPGIIYIVRHELTNNSGTSTKDRVDALSRDFRAHIANSDLVLGTLWAAINKESNGKRA